MSATNLTDTVKSLINSTIKNTVSGPVTTWEMRLQAYWQDLFGYSLGTVLCILIIYLSIFGKYITGDYKWFVLNQALANFFCAIGNIPNILVFYVWYSVEGYFLLPDGPPLGISILLQVSGLLMDIFGRYATIFTLLATVFNRWMAIVMPDHYQKFMSARLIVLYCTLCYLITIPHDSRLWVMFNLSILTWTLIQTGYYVIPLLLSIILSVSTFFKLWNHMRTTTVVTDKRMLQESRNVLYSLMIQIAVLFFEKINQVFMAIVANLRFITGRPLSFEDLGLSSILPYSISIYAVYLRYTNALTCIIILITMRPYRRALLSLISPITKFCRRHINPNIEPATTDNRVASNSNVVNVRPAWRANSP